MTRPVADTPLAPDHLSSVLRWSIADAWGWIGHGWKTLIHAPYLGVVALILGFVLVVRALGKILR